MKFTLEPIPPFDFELTAGFFSFDDPEIRIFDSGIFQQVLSLNNKLALAKLRSVGTVKQPKIICELLSNIKLDSIDKKRAKDIICSIFNLELDLNKFYDEVDRDKILMGVVSQLRGLKGPNNTTIFEGLACSIIEQQISLKVAFTVQKRFIKTFGQFITISGKKHYAFPEPGDVFDQKIEKFRSCGLSERKAEYIKGIAELIVNNDLDLEKFRNYPEPDIIIKDLTKIRGIGAWTVELTMLRSMGRFDIVPADDLGLKRYISQLYFKGEKISSNDVRKTLDKYGPWKGLVAYYLLEADRLGLNINEQEKRIGS
jgi:DNA-3-methyladenine glycosylase II